LEHAFDVLHGQPFFDEISKWFRSERDRMDAEARKMNTTNREWLAGASFVASMFLEMCDRRGRRSDPR
jgi:hypothetical protein